MKLYYSRNSPYSRKPRIILLELATADAAKIQLVDQSPRDEASGFYSVNPLARVPALELDDGSVLFDSPVICEYLDDKLGGYFFAGENRWDILKRLALGDGILDVGMLIRRELTRPEGERDSDLINRSNATIERVRSVLEHEVSSSSRRNLDIGDIAISCALAWLDFRMPSNWRSEWPNLGKWFQAIEMRPAFVATRPG